MWVNLSQQELNTQTVTCIETLYRAILLTLHSVFMGFFSIGFWKSTCLYK